MSMSCSSPAPALELLDEYWFFSNTLGTKKKKKKTKTPPPPPPLLPRSPSTSTGEKEKASGASGNQQQRVEVAAEEHDEVDDDDLNWSSIYQGVLRTRMAEGGGRPRSSALRRAPSMPVVVPSSGDGDGDGRRQTRWTPSSRMLRHSHSTLGRHTPPIMPKAEAEAEQRTPPPRREVRSPSLRLSASDLQLQEKKCKSSSDLESIEVQGFRDLGFVFDREELRRESLKQQQQTKMSPVRRPALARVQSAAEIKDQLRMWAQAVACNVRQAQEC